MFDAIMAILEGAGLIDDATTTDPRRRRNARLLLLALGVGAVVSIFVIVCFFWLS